MLSSKCIETNLLLFCRYSTTAHIENILYIYRGVYVSGKCLSLVLMLLWEQLGNSNLGKLLLAHYDATVRRTT